MFVPWKPHYTESEARKAIANASTWRDVLEALGYAYHGKNVKTVRKWAAIWGIPVDHLPERGLTHLYTEQEARKAIASSRSWAEALRKLDCCPTGGNPKVLKKRAAEWGIPTVHFDPHARDAALRNKPRKPLSEILTRNSTYSRDTLKHRLYEEGLKQRRCEMCGQGEVWRGRRISLILDHINGVRDDNRLENLRIVCPNCAATLDTHCGKRKAVPLTPRRCLHCDQQFVPKDARQRYCSRECGVRWNRTGIPRPSRRKVERPPYEVLRREVELNGYVAVGRKYGVSDNAVRKWMRLYEEATSAEAPAQPEQPETPDENAPPQAA